MKAKEPLFTAKLFVENQENQRKIIKAIKELKGSYELIDSADNLKSLTKSIVFVEEHLLDENFFQTGDLFERIEDLEVSWVTVGNKKKFIPQPLAVKRINSNLSNDSSGLNSLLESYIEIHNKFTQREKVLSKKLNRLFFLYHQLYEKESLEMSDILRLTNVSKRTIFRDFQLLREVLMTQTICLDDFDQKKYYIKDLKF
jgi:hypothetical protein